MTRLLTAATWPHLTHPVALLAVLGSAFAQCDLQTQPGTGLQGSNGYVNALADWDPDGAGPLTPRVVVGGTFTIAGNTAANHVASWDPTTDAFSPLGSGIDTPVAALAVAASGELLAAAGSQLLRWTAGAWVPIGPAPASSTIQAILPLPNGDVVVGGAFTTIGGVAANHIARWNGSAWAPLGAGTTYSPVGNPNNGVRALALLPSGDIVATGQFDAAGGLPANHIARWDGSAWFALGNGLTGPGGLAGAALAVRGNDLFVGGSFAFAGGYIANNVAMWDGTNWLGLDAGMPAIVSGVRALAAAPDGSLVAAGIYLQPTASGTALNISRWNGNSWAPIGAGVAGSLTAVLVRGAGELVVGGSDTGGLARWNGATWLGLGSGFKREGLPLLRRADGTLLVGGSFVTPTATTPRHLARFFGSQFTTFAGGTDGPVNAAIELPNGDVVIGGTFSEAGGTSANCIARWNGSAWSPLGTGISGGFGRVQALALLPNGHLIAGGLFSVAGGQPAANIARWDGTAWSPLGAGIGNGQVGQVQSLAVMQSGDLVVGGYFFTAGGIAANHLARWNGTAWSGFGSGCSAMVQTLRIAANGDLLVGGGFTMVNGIPAARIARLQGTSWNPVGAGLPGQVDSIDELPNGDLVVAGIFPVPNRLARWNGTTWQMFGSVQSTIDFVQRVLVDRAGTLFVGGTFQFLDGQMTAGFARLTTPCPATATPWGLGCSGSGGINSLAPVALPWLGSTASSHATGMPGNGIALAVHGFATAALPLASLLPQGGAGCVLRVQPDTVALLLPVGGAVDVSLPIPNSSALAGIVVQQQVLPVEIDAQGGLVLMTATNRVSLTIGQF